MKKIILLCVLIIPIGLRSETDSLPFITLNFTAGTGFYSLINHEKIPDSYMTQPFFNPTFNMEIGFRLSDKTQLFIGRNYTFHNYRIINSHPDKYGFVSKNVSNFIGSIPISLSKLIYNQNNTKLFFVSRFGFPKIITDVRYIYNDSIPVNPYSIRSRQYYTDERTIMASIGFGIEHKLFIKELFMICHAEYILGNRFGSAHSVNRFCISAGLSFKFY